MNRIIISLICLLPLPTCVYSAELANGGATAWKIVLPDKPTIVDDPQGWNGKSVRMGTKVDWNTSFAPPVRGKYRVLASLRCEGRVKEGKLGSWGVYDSRDKKSLKNMVLSAKHFANQDGSFDKRFRWIDLGVADFVAGAYFWFAHGHNPELDAIFVDRVVLVGAK